MGGGLKKTVKIWLIERRTPDPGQAGPINIH